MVCLDGQDACGWRQVRLVLDQRSSTLHTVTELFAGYSQIASRTSFDSLAMDMHTAAKTTSSHMCRHCATQLCKEDCTAWDNAADNHLVGCHTHILEDESAVDEENVIGVPESRGERHAWLLAHTICC